MPWPFWLMTEVFLLPPLERIVGVRELLYEPLANFLSGLGVSTTKFGLMGWTTS